MRLYKHISIVVAVVAFLFSATSIRVSGQVVQWAENATLVCKLKMGPIAEQDRSPVGTRCDTTCKVISIIKGNLGKEVQITFRRHANGPIRLGVDVTKAGEVYVVMLRGKSAPYEMFVAMKAVEKVVEPRFGAKPGDRLLAELVAMWRANGTDMHIPAIQQIGIMRDKRGSQVVNEAANSEDADLAHAGLIAQYRMGIAPDAKRTMELFDERMLFVWYQESGRLQSDLTGKQIMRREGGRVFSLRGLPDFDYATYVREGIKKEWVRRDESTLYSFFGVPWKVQRKECVPELVKLLNDPNKRVRWWAVNCLARTVDHVDCPRWEQYEKRESKELKKWRKWWKENRDAFMEETSA